MYGFIYTSNLLLTKHAVYIYIYLKGEQATETLKEYEDIRISMERLHSHVHKVCVNHQFCQLQTGKEQHTGYLGTARIFLRS